MKYRAREFLYVAIVLFFFMAPSAARAVVPVSGMAAIPASSDIKGFFSAVVHAAPVVGPLSIVSALVVAASTVAALAPLIHPGAFGFAYQWFMGALGVLPKRKKTWGTVYDADTKRPIPFARVQLLDRNKRVLETRTADNEGRYGFLTTPESLMAHHLQISIVARQSQYSFPSRATPTVDGFVYNNIYFGNLVEVNDSTLINFDIPMDPLKPAHIPLVIGSPSIAFGASVAALADTGFWLGIIMVPLNFILMPSPLTFGVMCLFLGTASLRLFGISEHPFGVVKDGLTGNALPFAMITLNDTGGKRIGFAVSDERGRYFLVVERGEYELNAFSPATVQPPRRFQTILRARKGWITREITL